jgi:hypothetical protein
MMRTISVGSCQSFMSKIKLFNYRNLVSVIKKLWSRLNLISVILLLRTALSTLYQTMKMTQIQRITITTRIKAKEIME